MVVCSMRKTLPSLAAVAAAGAVAMPGSASAAASRKLALIDVLGRGGYARLQGVADLRYVGRRLEVVSR